MIKLGKQHHANIYPLYLANDFFFPLIAAVLLNEQDGIVYIDNPASPSQIYIEHSFGFAQVIGKPNGDFEENLKKYWLIEKRFTPEKIRLYGTYAPTFLTSTDYHSLRSWRQRFIFNSNTIHVHPPREKNVSVCNINENNLEIINKTFGVVSRFWRTADDFINKSHAVIVMHDNHPVSICYSAAEANHRVEIDVLTLPEHRNLGLAKLAVVEFIRQCLALSLHPLWDCFTNNAGSMTLCKSVGFIASREPYPFYTINRSNVILGINT